MIFRITSETSPNTRYTVSLNTHFCDCASTTSTCKHILALQLIVKEYYHFLNDDTLPSSSANVEPTIEPLGEEVNNENFINDWTPETSDGQNLLQVICDLELVLLEVKSSIGKYREEEMKYKIGAIKECMH